MTSDNSVQGTPVLGQIQFKYAYSCILFRQFKIVHFPPLFLRLHLVLVISDCISLLVADFGLKIFPFLEFQRGDESIPDLKHEL